MCKGGRKIWMIIIFAPVFIAVYGFGVMLLWNWLMPGITGVTEITFWQSLGLIFLSKLLFGFHGGRWGKKHHHRKHMWKHKMKERFGNMSPEEKAQFKEQWRKKCGWEKFDFDEEEANQNPEDSNSDSPT